MVGERCPRLPLLLGLLAVVEEVQVIRLSVCNTRESQMLAKYKNAVLFPGTCEAKFELDKIITYSVREVVCKEVNFIQLCEYFIS
jgi:hypothetical protein